ncbi:hypothetical protein KCU62_g218, partial [Aureobasidium sp. EXF-3399]
MGVGDSESAKSLGQRLTITPVVVDLLFQFAHSLFNISYRFFHTRQLNVAHTTAAKSQHPVQRSLRALSQAHERHPLNIPFSRRLDEWNPKRLHWIIRTPLSISKKRTIRSWVTRRFRDTLIDELKNSGFNRWGEPLVPSRLKSPLTGALAITILPPALTASVQDVRHICSSILRKNVFSRQRPTR